MKKITDILFAFTGLLLLLPVLILASVFIKLGSQGSVFYKQTRVGKNEQLFKIWKFRTMVSDADKSGQLTLGTNDSRITSAGKFLRKSKLDELPQLINVLLGEMSIVGPRPEVPEYVALYTAEQRKVLSVLPGITDPASIQFSNESEILEKYDDPEKAYREEIMPYKLKVNLEYIERRDYFMDLGVIYKTLTKIFD